MRPAGHHGSSTFVLLTLRLFTITAHDYDYENIPEELCDGNTPIDGVCITVVDQPMDWHAAEEYCHGLAPNSDLASVRTIQRQMFLSTEAQDANLPEVWVGGCLKAQFWHWSGESTTLAFQGCYIDDPMARDLTIHVMDPSITKPSECISRCREMKFNYAGVQRTAGDALLCHCGDDYGSHGRSLDAACNGECQGVPLDNNNIDLIDVRCGGLNRQLIFDVTGSPFYRWVPETSRGGDACAYMEGASTRMWADADCSLSKKYICFTDWADEVDCRSIRGSQWTGEGCVTIVDEPQTWWDAIADCAQHDSHLISLTTPELQESLQRFLEEDTVYWIGLTYDYWEWSTGHTIFEFFNWEANQPSKGPDQECISMKQPGYKWLNKDCDRRLPFMCQSAIVEEEGETTSEGPVTVSPSADPGPGGSPGLPLTVILGAAIGGGAGLLLSIAIIVAACLHYRKNRREPGSSATESTFPGRPLPARPNTNRKHGVGNPAYNAQSDRVRGLPPNADRRNETDSRISSGYEKPYTEVYPNDYDTDGNHKYEDLK